MALPLGLFIYRKATGILSPISKILLRQRAARGKEDVTRLAERQGLASRPRPAGPLVWVHGASVGECVSALPLIAHLCESNINVLITSGTVTSAQVMARLKPSGAIHQFVPVDTPQATARFLDHWRPDVGLFVDSDLWPNLLLGAKARGVKLAMVNARISPKSFENWKRAPRTVKALLDCFEVCLAQDDAIAARFKELGAGNVQVVGSLKSDAPALTADEAKLEALRSSIGGRPVFLAAQTHPGEDETILPAHDILRIQFPDLLTILVPRHTERGKDIAMLCGGRPSARRSTGALPTSDIEVYVADTMGELGLFYRLAPFAFIGGSLVPMGGHNPLEAAKLGCAVMAGPHVFNSASAFAAIFMAQGFGQVLSSTDIVALSADLLASPDKAKAAGAAAQSGAATLGGAVAKTAIIVETMLRHHAAA